MDYKGDTHIHTEYSFDSKSKIKNLIEKAEDKNLDFIAFTDHVEFSVQPIKEVIHRIKNRNQKIDELQQETNIKLIKGLEISEPHLYLSEMDYLQELNDIDYIIGSIHHVYGISLRKMTNVKNIYKLYLQSMLKMVNSTEIDTLAHLDYIKKYIQREDFDKELLKEILNVIIERNIALEVNTSGARRNTTQFPDKEILAMYKELGGKNITLGSDAHREEELYDHIPIVNEEIEDLNFNKGYVLKRRFRNIK